MMRCDEFVGLLAAISSGAQAARQGVLDEWRIAEDFDSVDVDTKRQMFSLVEKAMESGDSCLVTAVATGLIEAVATRAIQRESLWRRMAPFLGPRSLHHAEAWLTM